MQRWTSSYRFEWTPIVTFARRQLRFLDWIEANLEPVSFYDLNGVTGVALVSKSIRLTVDRNGMTLEDGSALEAGVTLLERAVEGVFEVLEPIGARLRSGSVAWSGPIEHVAYNEARAHLARKISGIPLDSDCAVPMDVSSLVDVLSPDYRGQVEWGVVSAKELIERLSMPEIGRLSSNRPKANLTGIDAEDLPDASLFVDTTFWPLDPPLIADRVGISDAVARVNEESERLARVLYAQSEMGRNDELDANS